MRSAWKVIAASLLASVLAGCAAFTNFNAPEKAKATPPAGSGIIILSTGAKERCFTAATELMIMSVSARSALDIAAGAMVDNYSVKSDFSDHQGNVHVIALPAGEYLLYPNVLNPMLVSTQTPKAEFEVKAGETAYIGEFYMTKACSWSNIMDFRDEFDRDMTMVRARNPAFADVKVEKRIARFTGFVVGSQQ